MKQNKTLFVTIIIAIVVAVSALIGFYTFQKPAKERLDFLKGNTHQTPTPTVTPTPIKPKIVKVKGIYMTGWTAGYKTKFDSLLNLINKTELNAVVLDIKDDDGRVTYNSQVPLVKEIGSYAKMVPDITKTLKILHDNNIYVIGRIVTFKDPILASKKPELAIKTVTGAIWRDRKKAAWLNAYNPDSWQYDVDLAKEACQLGFDEIQFDYVRFPTDGKVKEIDFGKSSQGKPLTDAINNFLAYAKKEISPYGKPVAADVFGIITTNTGDVEKLGQDMASVGKDIDYLCPMVYPSHYALGQYNIKKPDLEPYNVVFKSISTAKQRIDQIPGYKAKLRPWLQDFTASWIGKGNYKKYTAEDVRAQIKAVYDSGVDEWILWNANNNYTPAALVNE